MSINYKKINNKELFDLLENDYLDVEKLQNYIPLYQNYFNLNNNNYNSINLNNKYHLTSIDHKYNYNKYSGYVNDNSNNKIKKPIFFKFSPLIDTSKYMLGKIDEDYNLLELPKFINDEISKEYLETYHKILDCNNSAYSDSFFSYLSSLLLNNYNFFNGIDYYGSFIGIKKNFMLDIADEIEYLQESQFFMNNLNKLFKIDQNDIKLKNLFNTTKKFKNKLHFLENQNDHDEESELELDIQSIEIDNNINNINKLTTSNLKEHELTLEYDNDIKKTKSSNQDINNNNTENENENETETETETKNKSEISKNLSTSSSNCSSRTSNTIDSDKDSQESSSKYSDSESQESSSDEEDEEIICTIEKFPCEIISLECCENTLDDYIANNKITDKELETIILQIIFTLITYQKLFNFTHNDLHTNNIVYITTEKKFLYYKFNNKHYKIPTYGKIYKIIDFGRAIYQYKGKIICSDSYSSDGDANTQYNFEPYFNENKPRLEPNYSFDLSRLGCSLFDYYIDDLDDIRKVKSSIKKIILSWVYDDKNRNILYKNNGEERYPDFKLYKMIARTVHNHTPQKVLNNEIFNNYLIAKKKINNTTAIFSIDDIDPLI